jgi:hypothetical protein
LTAGIKANVDGSAAIQVGGVDAITLTSAGAASFVTSPMTIQGGSAAAPSITFSGDTNTGIFSPAADTIAFSEGGVESMRIDSAGNVGIGTSSPNERVTIAASTSGSYIQICDSSTGTTSGDGLFIGSFNGAAEIKTKENKELQFGTNNTERARIDSSGNLLVNRTSLFNSEKFGVTFSSNTGAGCVINDSNGQNGNTFIQFRNNGTTAGAITSNGTTTMTYGSASDYRLKENLSPLTGALAKVALLKPTVGSWKVDGSEFVGFIAHELQEVFPDSVVGEKDKADSNGDPEYQMVDTGSASIIATLTAALQEQQQMIETLQAKVAALEAK